MSTASSPPQSVRLPEVMVSYSSQDRGRVMEFVRTLRASGVAVWIDQGGIDGAQRWSEEIVNAIEACRVVLLFISRPSMESANIGKEVALAWESGKQFLPVALEEAKIPKSMQYQLAGIQYVKYYEGDAQAKFESVLRALVRLGVRVSPYSMAVVSAGLGDREQALEWLSKALEERSGGLSRLGSEPRFQSLRSDPRFAEFSRRVEGVTLQPEGEIAEVVLPQPLSQTPYRPAGPEPAWKQWLWPDVVDDRSSRAAAGQGVWASAAIIAASWLFSLFVPNTLSIQGWWNDPIVLSVMFAAIGIGVQKMGRPAAVIGTVLCGMGVLGNLDLVSTLRGIVAAEGTYSNLPNQPNYTGIYYSAWFGLLAGIAFAAAFVNAWRGTFAYRAFVDARQTPDKQDALGPEELLVARRRVATLVQRVWGKGPLGSTSGTDTVATQPGTEAAFAAIPTSGNPTTGQAPMVGSGGPDDANGNLPESSVMQEVPAFEEVSEIQTLGDLIGSNPVSLTRSCAFLVANLASGLAFMLARSVTLPGPLHPVYWQLAVLRAVVVTLGAWLAFRFLRQGWIASLIAAGLASLLMLPVYNTLATFDYGDLFYREQFQQFLLVPFVEVLAMLLGLFFLVPRIRPLALGLWTGAVCSEIAAGMLLKTLREVGSGGAPDPVLWAVVAVIVGLRSLIFALVFWAGLRLAGLGRRD